MKELSIFFVVTVTLLAGCSLDSGNDDFSEAPTGRVFGGPSDSALFTPYQGDWHFETRRLDPEPERNALTGGSDITVTGHIIRLGYRELRLCQARKVERGIESEAWHHEDIYDPGDMQRADCKIYRKGDNLELHWRIVSSGNFSDDPIIASNDYSPPDRSKADIDELTWWIETYSPKPAR